MDTSNPGTKITSILAEPKPTADTAITQLEIRKRDTHMITGELRNQINRIWDAFWSGGISNPMEVIPLSR